MFIYGIRTKIKYIIRYNVIFITLEVQLPAILIIYCFEKNKKLIIGIRLTRSLISCRMMVQYFTHILLCNNVICNTYKVINVLYMYIMCTYIEMDVENIMFLSCHILNGL